MQLKSCESLQPLAYVLCVCVGLQAIFVDIGEEELSETSSLVCQCRKLGVPSRKEKSL